MTYFGFLLRFLVIPIIALVVLAYWDRRRGLKLPERLSLLPPHWMIGVLVVVAVVYTTPWDNYLVATGVWFYNPQLVTGITLGWVPLEEYTFFVLQSIMTGLWLLWLARRLTTPRPFVRQPKIRIISTAAVAVLWLASLVLLLSGYMPGNYLALELVWALLPIGIQLAVGADILWHYRRVVGLTLLTATLYLCATDSLAIGSGTWTISPQHSLNLFIGGVLPIEEVIFFLITNVLLVFGLTLGLARETLGNVPAQWLNRKTA